MENVVIVGFHGLDPQSNSISYFCPTLFSVFGGGRVGVGYGMGYDRTQHGTGQETGLKMSGDPAELQR